MTDYTISKDLEKKYNELIKPRESQMQESNQHKDSREEVKMKDLDISISLDYIEKVQKHLERANKTIMSLKGLGAEAVTLERKVVQEYGIETDILEELEGIKYYADARYVEMRYELILINTILRNMVREDFSDDVSDYLEEIKDNRVYILDKDTMANILQTEDVVEIESKIFQAERNVKKSIARINIEAIANETLDDIEKAVIESGGVIEDIYSNLVP